MAEVSDIVVCNGQVENIDFTTDNSGGITSYVWENTGGVDVGLGSSSGTIEDTSPDLSFTATNAGSDPISTQITVYPTFENNDVTCTSASHLIQQQMLHPLMINLYLQVILPNQLQ